MADCKPTKLLAWFTANEKFENARHIRYIDYPKYFTWNKTNLVGKPCTKFEVRQSGKKEFDFRRLLFTVVRRMNNISPREEELSFLRTLLLHRAGISSFKYMVNLEGKQYSSYLEACCAMGLLADNAEWMRCLHDTFRNTLEPLKTVFPTIFAFCESSSSVSLWEKNIANILTDLRRRYDSVPKQWSFLKETIVYRNTQCMKLRMRSRT